MPPPPPFSFEPPQPPWGEQMVGIVVVSHSWPLARAAVEMTRQMVPAPLPQIEVAAGLDEHTLGTDAVRVKEAIERANGPDGVLVLLDLGSAVLSGELALDLLDDAVRSRVVLSPAPLVEGLIAAAVTAAGGAPMEDVAEEASSGLAAKRAHLGAGQTTVALPADSSTSERGTNEPLRCFEANCRFTGLASSGYPHFWRVTLYSFEPIGLACPTAREFQKL